MNSTDLLAQLHQIIDARLTCEPNDSYVASLADKGLDAVLKKVGEEATETVMAAKDGDVDKLVHEVADLWFHTMILLAQQGASAQAVIAELDRRMGVSGLVEKAARTKT